MRLWTIAWKWPGERWLSGLGLLLILAVSIALAWNAWDGPAVTHRLNITGGRLPGTKQQLATVLVRESSRMGVDFTIKECSGSVEALDLVNDGRVNVALVQGGLDSKRWSEVRQVASLHVEPLQLVVRGDLAAEVTANLGRLKGHSINLGEVGSGSEILTREVFRFVGLRADSSDALGDYLATSLSPQQLLEIKRREQLPDAVITVASLPAPVIRHLVTVFGYRLVPLPFGEAFALKDLILDPDSSETNSAEVRAVVDKVHLHETHIPAFTYGVEPAVPVGPLPTFGARVLVVAHKDTPNKAVARLLEAIFLTNFSEVARPPLETALLDLPPEFPLHPGTVQFMQRNKPLIVGDAVDFLEKTSSLTGALLGGLFVAWQWARRRYRRRRELGFEAYLLKVTAIERQALQLELAPRLDLAALLTLQGELGRVKTRAMERFTSGELEGEGLISGFLTHANDARDYLARLILHARTLIEKQGLTPEAAWDLAIGPTEVGSEDPEVAESD